MVDFDQQQGYGQRNEHQKKPRKQPTSKINLPQTCLIVLGIIIFLTSPFALKFFRAQRQKIFIDDQYSVKLAPHTLLEQARPADQAMVLWKITSNTQSTQTQQNQQKASCVFISATNLVTKTTINTVIELLKTGVIGTAYIMANLRDIHSNHVIRRQLQGYSIMALPVAFNSDLEFAGKIKNQCRKLVYVFGNFLITSEMSANIKQQVVNMKESTLFYTTSHELKGQATQLQNLSTANLAEIQPINFYSYLYIFDTQYLDIVTPTNFVYYAKYTIEQMILIPNLVLFQSSGKMYTNTKIMHSVGTILGQFRKVSIVPLSKSKNLLCFVSYPFQPDQINSQDVELYLKSIENQKKFTDNSKPTVILYAPYTDPQNKQISTTAQKLVQMLKDGNVLRAKLRIIPKKISSTHAVYESAHTFCPNGALAISSRHNVQFHANMLKQVLASLSVKYHYYYFNVVDERGQVIALSAEQNSQLMKFQQNQTIFQEKLRHVQVFKTDLMKMVPFWILKSAELDFFQTEIPFVFNMLQVIKNFGIGFIQKTLATVKVQKILQKQKNQIVNFKHYTPYYPLTQNYLIPINFNCLQISAFERNAPFKMQANIHQIWLGKGQINQLRMKLHNSIIDANKNFKVFLWRHENVTKSNFPLTFNLLNIVSQKHKTSVKSIYAMAADILRYETILNFGGIYMDFKFQGHKPLDNFRKYELIFADTDISDIRFGSPKAVGNPFMAATSNNYHLKMTLTQLLNERTINFYGSLPEVTGGFVLRKSLTDFELHTQVTYGQHLTIPNPYQESKDYCGGKDRNFTKQQQIFEVKIEKDEIFALGVPCNRYQLSYLVLVSPLKGTWLKKKENVN